MLIIQPLFVQLLSAHLKLGIKPHEALLLQTNDNILKAHCSTKDFQ